MLGIMSRSDRKGFLSINGKPMGSKELAKFVGEFKDKVEELLVELEYYRVFSRDEDGTIYNRRMVRESDLSRKRSEAGRLGGIAKQESSKSLAKGSSKPQARLEDEDEYSLKSKDKGVHPDDLRLVELLVELMLKNNPQSSIIKRLNSAGRERWANVCRKLRDIDGHSAGEIESLIRFSQEDSFWSGNILSMPTLREKWDQLVLKAKRIKGECAGARVGARAPQSDAEKEITRKVGEFIKAEWEKAEVSVEEARAKGPKEYQRVKDQLEREIGTRAADYHKTLKGER